MSLYTYFDGKKIELEKLSDSFIARAEPAQLSILNLIPGEQLSSASWRVRTDTKTLDSDMKKVRDTEIVAHHEYHKKDSGQALLITDRILVSFEKRPSEEEVSALMNDYALELIYRLSETEILFRLTRFTGTNPVKLVVQLTEKQVPNIAFVNHDLNYVFTVQAPESNFDLATAYSAPSDPALARQWHLHTKFAHPDVDPRSSSRCMDAWDKLGNLGSSNIVIGITDDGCKLDHRDFDGHSKFADWGYMRGSRLVHRDSIDADPAAMHEHGANHGTACAGVAAAEADDILTVGAAPAARLLPIKWQSHQSSLFISSSKMLTVLNFIADKVDILSNSWGSAPDNTWSKSVTDRIAELTVSGGRRGNGILFLWAAGNRNCPILHQGDVDIPYTRGFKKNNGQLIWVGVSTSKTFQNSLAEIPGVMHVAALASTAQRSHYSNYGNAIDICAASSNLHLYGRVEVRGRNITTASGPHHPNDVSTEVTESFGGTSSATPLVAGIAALMLSANPELSPLQLQKILQDTASKDLNFEGYPKTPPAPYDMNPSWDVSPVAPHNTGEFDENGWSSWFGYGKVDAYEAIVRAIALAEANESGSDIIEGGPDVVLENIEYEVDTVGDELDHSELSTLAEGQRTVLPPTRNASVTQTLTLTLDDGRPAPGIAVNASARPVSLTANGWRDINALASRWHGHSARILRERHSQGIIRTQGQLDKTSGVTDRNGQARFTVRAWHVCGEESQPATDRVTYTWHGGQMEADISCGMTGLQVVPHDESRGVHVKGAIRGRRFLQQAVNSALLTIGDSWRQTSGKPSGMPDYFVVTDASLRWGGLIPPHLSHRFGGAVDIRPISTDGQPTRVGEPNYSRVGTKLLIDYLNQTGTSEIIFGEQLPGVTRVKENHRDHIHASWMPQPMEPWFVSTATEIAANGPFGGIV